MQSVWFITGLWSYQGHNLLNTKQPYDLTLTYWMKKYQKQKAHRAASDRPDRLIWCSVVALVFINEEDQRSNLCKWEWLV